MFFPGGCCRNKEARGNKMPENENKTEVTAEETIVKNKRTRFKEREFPNKRKSVAVILWILGFLGLFQIHLFYLGMIKTALVKLAIFFFPYVLAIASIESYYSIAGSSTIVIFILGVVELFKIIFKPANHFRETSKKARIILICVASLIVVIPVVSYAVYNSNPMEYMRAENRLNDGSFYDAELLFSGLGNYRDAPQRAAEAREHIVYLRGGYGGRRGSGYYILTHSQTDGVTTVVIAIRNWATIEFANIYLNFNDETTINADEEFRQIYAANGNIIFNYFTFQTDRTPVSVGIQHYIGFSFVTNTIDFQTKKIIE
jgi:TM2 domain-containing membrane protein YozV